jgi:hypothetical protein
MSSPGVHIKALGGLGISAFAVTDAATAHIKEGMKEYSIVWFSYWYVS